VRERSKKNTKQSSKLRIRHPIDHLSRAEPRSRPMNSSGAGGSAAEWEDSAGEMDSEDNHHGSTAGAVGMGMMEVDADAQDLAAEAPTSSSPAPPSHADFFNSFPDDFDDQDLA
jgi:hypothetical protein